MNLPTNKATMSSLEIAQLTGKHHKDVMRSIRNMEPAWEKVNGRKFALVQYSDSKGESRPMYELSKTECLYVATKFNDEARAKLVMRWEALETGSMAQNKQLTAAMVTLTESLTAVVNITNNHNQRIERLEKLVMQTPQSKRSGVKGIFIDARNQEYDFVKINHSGVRRIIIDEVPQFSINDFCNAIGVNTGSYQIAKKLNSQRPTAVKIWIFGNTHPAWFTTKNGLRLLVSGSRNLKNDKNIKLELRRV